MAGPVFWVLWTVPLLAVAVFVLVRALPLRLRMERRAKDLLAQMPQHELRTVYLAFNSVWPRARESKIAAKISQEQQEGWTFLRASEASPLKTIRTWGGGVNLHFIRKS
jgi:hypothetical protein